jgi:hypothetical protein
MPERRTVTPLLVMALAAGCAIGAPASVPDQTATPVPTPDPTPAVSVTPTPEPTPMPEPTPTPDPSLLGLDAISCEGGVVLEWTPSTDARFHHYTALRSPEREIARNYPPLQPAVDWGDTFATDRFVTSAVDASIIPSDLIWNYRVVAYDAANRAIGASPVRAARLRQAVDLDPFEAASGPDGLVRLSWQPYGGVASCFTAYRLLVSSGGGTSSTLRVVSDQTTSTITTDALSSGVTYQLRVEAVRTTTLGSFVLGQTETITFTVP